MRGITWTGSFNTGLDDIDAQHKILISHANALNTAMRERRDKAQLETLFENLIDYLREHFQYEEALMKQIGFPGLAAHTIEHAQSLEELLSTKKDHERHEGLHSLELRHLIMNWIVRHIMQSDKDIGRFLAASGR